jgi:hypothetical protein
MHKQPGPKMPLSAGLGPIVIYLSFQIPYNDHLIDYHKDISFFRTIEFSACNVMLLAASWIRSDCLKASFLMNLLELLISK